MGLFRLDSEDEIEAAVVERQPLWNDRRHETGPFDIVGDVDEDFAVVENLQIDEAVFSGSNMSARQQVFMIHQGTPNNTVRAGFCFTLPGEDSHRFCFQCIRRFYH